MNPLALIVEELTGAIPPSLARELRDFNLDDEFARIRTVAEKDSKRILGFVPAIMQKISELSFSLGLIIGKGDLSVSAIAKVEEAVQFIRETMGVIRMWEAQSRSLSLGDVFSDPTKDEREITRIWAKRNNLSQEYRDILGVSAGTPRTYPESFDRWLR